MVPNNVEELQKMSGIHIGELLKPRSRALALVENRGVITAKDLQDIINRQQLSRREKNIILKGLPSVYRIMIEQNILLDQDLGTYIPIENNIKSPESVSPSKIQEHFKYLLKKVDEIKLCRIYKDNSWNDNPDDWISGLWKIKHPNLRNYRFKAIFKDIFSRERMKRFGMIDSELCEICGMTESVQHQLFDCVNATKIRQYAERIHSDLQLVDLYSLIKIGTDNKAELLKCLVLKQLIQIDRSKSLTYKEFEKLFNWYSTITNVNT